VVINRALRATSIVVLAALTAFVGAGLRHGAPGRVQAQDTTWAVTASDADSDATKSQPTDTTWAVSDGNGGSAAVQALRADTTW